MTVLASIFGLLAFVGLGAFTLYMLVDLLEYIKRFHGPKWHEITYERPFGIPRENFLFYPVRPLQFVTFLFSMQTTDDQTISGCKKRIKLALGGLGLMLVIFFVTLFIG